MLLKLYWYQSKVDCYKLRCKLKLPGNLVRKCIKNIEEMTKELKCYTTKHPLNIIGSSNAVRDKTDKDIQNQKWHIWMLSS